MSLWTDPEALLLPQTWDMLNYSGVCLTKIITVMQTALEHPYSFWKYMETFLPKSPISFGNLYHSRSTTVDLDEHRLTAIKLLINIHTHLFFQLQQQMPSVPRLQENQKGGPPVHHISGCFLRDCTQVLQRNKPKPKSCAFIPLFTMTALQLQELPSEAHSK